jgi:hypothetical protein
MFDWWLALNASNEKINVKRQLQIEPLSSRCLNDADGLLLVQEQELLCDQNPALVAAAVPSGKLGSNYLSQFSGGEVVSWAARMDSDSLVGEGEDPVPQSSASLPFSLGGASGNLSLSGSDTGAVDWSLSLSQPWSFSSPFSTDGSGSFSLNGSGSNLSLSDWSAIGSISQQLSGGGTSQSSVTASESGLSMNNSLSQPYTFSLPFSLSISGDWSLSNTVSHSESGSIDWSTNASLSIQFSGLGSTSIGISGGVNASGTTSGSGSLSPSSSDWSPTFSIEIKR